MPTQTTQKTKEQPASLTAISRACFAEMQSRVSLALTAPYHAEESQALEDVLQEYKAQGIQFDHLIAIGCANLRYMDVALRHNISYTAIDPNLEDHLSSEKMEFIKRNNGVSLIGKSFSDIAANDLPEGRKLFFFLFNVFPYIENAVETQKRLSGRGDVAIVSSWNRESLDARRLQKVYYTYLQEAFSCAVSPEKMGSYMNQLEKECAGFSASQSRVKGKTTDILTVKL